MSNESIKLNEDTDGETSGNTGKETKQGIENLIENVKGINEDLERDVDEIRKLREQLGIDQQPESNSKEKPTTPCQETDMMKMFKMMMEMSSKNLRFEDAEKSFKQFHGNGNMSIAAWIDHFTNQADLFELNDRQRFAFAKRLMKGTAKLFVDNESKANTWIQLQVELKAEYGKKLNSATIHRKLQERRKKREETPIQYLYEMMALANQANIDEVAVITYVVDGLPGSDELKASMYEAETFSELKKKLHVYVMLQKKQNSKYSKQEFKPRFKRNDYNPDKDKCDDATKNVPDESRRQRGPCFKCGKYGHISRFCSSEEDKEKKKMNCLSRMQSEMRKWVTINGKKLYSLFDTGSDYTVVREDKMKGIDCVVRDVKHERTVKGVGGLAPLR